MITLYGLKNCDTCKLALREITSAGLEHRFVDIRDEAELVSLVPAWVKLAGAKALLNTRSTTWRGLSIQDQRLADAEPAALLIANPTLIKRPVITIDGKLHVGWTPAVREAVLGVAA
ncbi:ArsC/Spx/MgsR family protein [uncultured Maricaulis sp.]|uniref:arsenate reductase family protein n=1 Tax=uncultured Maricaulis sp. TaxID=174710 RepID=UPI0030DC14B0|tara:strand:+ start:5092 stop:5442 length:351 start_codon:yes stop_codon:yes gene_type:complete